MTTYELKTPAELQSSGIVEPGRKADRVLFAEYSELRKNMVRQYVARIWGQPETKTLGAAWHAAMLRMA